MKEKYFIFHHNDLDGVASAAVLADALEKTARKIAGTADVDYHLLPQWTKENYFSSFKKKGYKIAVVDFPYHPQCDIWLDHHQGPFKKKLWEKNFKESIFLRFQPEYKSCAHQVLDFAKKELGYKPPTHIKHLVRWADVVDGALYDSAKQAISFSVPAIALARALGSLEKKEISQKPIVKALKEDGVKGGLAVPVIERTIRSLKKDDKRILKLYETLTRVEKDVAIVDESKMYGQLKRYYPYYKYPQIHYAVRYFEQPEKKNWHISAGWNPWNKPKNGVNIGDLLKSLRIGGGGHKAVGGMEASNKEEVEELVGEVVRVLKGGRRGV